MTSAFSTLSLVCSSFVVAGSLDCSCSVSEVAGTLGSDGVLVDVSVPGAGRCTDLGSTKRVVEANGLEGSDEVAVVVVPSDVETELVTGRRARRILRFFNTCSSAFGKGEVRSPAPSVS